MKSKLSLLGLVITMAFFTFFSLTLPKYQYFIIYSGSMEPIIPKGSLVIAKYPQRTDLLGLKVGDIITFAPNKSDPMALITHRIIKINKTIFTKGDYNLQPDLWNLQRNQIRGIYNFNVPYLGYLLHFLKTYPWYLMVIFGLIVTFPLDNHFFSHLRLRKKRLGKALAFFLPLLLVLWANPALALWNKEQSQKNYFATDSIYNNISVTAGATLNNLGVPVASGQENMNLDFGTLNKPTTFSDVIRIKNISSMPINLRVTSNLTLFSLGLGTNMLQAITLNPQESTFVKVTINPLRNKNYQLYLGDINLIINNSNFYVAKIPAKFYDK